jgi:hypothetical protein
MYQEPEIDPRLLKWFEAMQEIPPADAVRCATRRTEFISQAQMMAPAVSKTYMLRQNGWKHPITSDFLKEHKPMFQIFGTLILAISLLLGAGGITTLAAQSSLPDAPLYALKLWSEEARLNLASAPEDWQLVLEFAERRVAEIQQMVENGQTPPEAVQIRLREQSEQAIRLALSGQDDEVLPALEQIRLRLEKQMRLLMALHSDGNPGLEAALVQARQTLQERQGWVEDGLHEPNWLREQLRLRLSNPELPFNTQEQNRYHTAQPEVQNQSGNTGCLNCTPLGTESSGNPWTTDTPTPGSGYGEGQGSNPWTTGTPIPGSGYGSGLNPSQTPPTGGPGFGQTTPTRALDGSGSGAKQPTSTSQMGDDHGGLKPTDSSGPGSGRP